MKIQSLSFVSTQPRTSLLKFARSLWPDMIIVADATIFGALLTASPTVKKHSLVEHLIFMSNDHNNDEKQSLQMAEG